MPKQRRGRTREILAESGATLQRWLMTQLWLMGTNAVVTTFGLWVPESAAGSESLFFFVYQMFDGYVLTPLVQERSVCLPPALTIMIQVLLGVLFDSLGVIFAVSLLAVFLVVIKMGYIEGVLHESMARCLHGP